MQDLDFIIYDTIERIQGASPFRINEPHIDLLTEVIHEYKQEGLIDELEFTLLEMAIAHLLRWELKEGMEVLDVVCQNRWAD